jgi:hypothetical protein
MFWALGAIILQLHAVPQQAVSAVKNVQSVQIEQTSTESKVLLAANNSPLNDSLPLEPARLLLTPVAAPAASPAAFAPVTAIQKKRDTRFAGTISDGSQRAWKGFAVVGHSAAVFDAWSTRQALDRGAHELNPMLKPFAGNSSMYAAAQVGPTLLDLLSHKMLTSQHSFFRKTWWIPQIVGTAASLTAGINNLHQR